MGDSLLDLAAVPSFIKSEWIGIGKKYPTTDTPLLPFLCLLSLTPNTTAVGIELAQEDAERFRILSAGE